jgi:hypothetical protein
LETFTASKEFVESYRYLQDRQENLKGLDLRVIDQPITRLIEGFNSLAQCFTLQSCYGHFQCAGQDPRNLERLPRRYDSQVSYRIAYVAFCLENSPRGRALHESLANIPTIDPDYVQFGCAEWFWHKSCNSYVLQVEPVRYKDRDQIVVDHSEALHIEKIRDLFFIKLQEILERFSSDKG